MLAIDFGTTNTLVGYLVEGEVKLVELEGRECSIPTAMFLDFQENEILFGSQAKKAYVDFLDGRYLRSLKILFGTSLLHEKQFFFGKQITFADLIVEFISHLKLKAEKQSCQRFTSVLAGRPVRFFSDGERDKQAENDLKKCYLKAGFEHVIFVHEPAAALASAKCQGNSGFVLDIGGGTTDISLYKQKEHVSLIGSKGIRVGGTNLDSAISLKKVMPLLGIDSKIRKEMGQGVLEIPKGVFRDLSRWERIPSVYEHSRKRAVESLVSRSLEPNLVKRLVKLVNDQLGHKLLLSCEMSKIAVNDGQDDQIALDFIEHGLSAYFPKESLYEIVSPYTSQMIGSTLELLSENDVSPSNIDEIVLVGGTSLINNLQAELKTEFVNASFVQEHVFTAVITGLTILSGEDRNERI